MKTRTLRIIIALILGVGLSAAVALYQAPQNTTTTSVAGAKIGGSFTGLTANNGQVFNDASVAGKSQLVFFGFTHCPSICPTELQKMTVLLNDLTPAQRDKLAVIFVSVDPERDTAQSMNDYLSLFHPNIIGLRGTPEQTDQVKSDWKVYAARVQTPEMTEYTVDHSAFTYLRDPNGNLITLFSTTDSTDEMTRQVKAHLGQ